MADVERLRGGRAFARYGPADLVGLRDAFLGFVPDEGRMFAPRVDRCDAGGLDVKLQRCPLKEAWFSADTWQPGRDGCCHLHVRPGKAR